MLRLPDVTLVIAEDVCPELSQMAMDECTTRAKFGDVISIIEKDKFNSIENWQNFIWHDLPSLIKTKHMLLIQWDSWIINPTVWVDCFQGYDYIGAPWCHPTYNVGNGGFSLRSKRLMDFLQEHKDEFPCPERSEDEMLCRGYRSELERHGFIWAPEPIAHDFSFECHHPSISKKHFGFHAMRNWPYVLESDELKRRVKIAIQNKYIRSTCMVNDTLNAAPWLIDALHLEVA